jgi:hypothetical protein
LRSITAAAAATDIGTFIETWAQVGGFDALRLSPGKALRSNRLQL